MTNKMIVILGATASGKTKLAVRLAHELNGEIISADSRQVYKSLDIGTGKDLNEYIVDGRIIPYHLIDVTDPEKEFNLFEFQSGFYEIYWDLIHRNVLPVVVGGTGLYLESIILNYHLPPAPPDQELRKNLQTRSVEELQKYLLAMKASMHNKTDLENKDRLIRAIEIERARESQSSESLQKQQLKAAVFGIRWDRAVLRKRITARLRQRLEEGMLEEVQSLHMAGLSWAKLESFGLEYRYISRYLQGHITYQEMYEQLNTRIHQFAKRQDTWFRRMERKGVAIDWISGDDYILLKERIIKYLND
ncbi:MAG: tRNA (adenosine(37)-N6)-dimethylallyltransferase MiaA [Deltaproteobacteria bacterium HGW-Deltaproteobacteria-12]|jgi:tRNA dimethylallyltransferase|nr:MAG: tRNA (adenosine(37)-N6)-dimethylallyltransferase MiaA [Deltaproteobacteria bacterium HGW-Deltaproteobacteria-12]